MKSNDNNQPVDLVTACHIAEMFGEVWARLPEAYDKKRHRALNLAAEDVFKRLVNNRELAKQFLSGEQVMVVMDLSVSVFGQRGFAVGFISAGEVKGGL